MDNNTRINSREKHSLKNILLFLIPSVLGVGCLLIPIPNRDGSFDVGLSYICNWASTFFNEGIILVSVWIIIIGAILTLLFTCFKVPYFSNLEPVYNTFHVGIPTLLFRIAAGVLIAMIYWQVGPEWLIGPDTGAFVLYDLVGIVFLLGVIAGLVLPFLTEFGLMEFIGTLCAPFFKPVFRIPGRAAVDCISSWIGATAPAIIITDTQLQKGYYTKREAAVISTTFSAVTITFAMIVCDYVGFGSRFYEFYVVVCVIGVICALIMPRIWPLCKIPDEYMGEKKYDGEKVGEEGYSTVQWAWQQAIKKAAGSGYSLKTYFNDWGKAALTMTFTMPPFIITIGTLCLALAYYTPILNWLGMPFVPLLNVLGVPEASEAAPAMIAGFADMFIPAMLAAGTITSPFTKCLIGIVSITQLIFISETGAYILSTKIPVNILQLAIIFIERTLISLLVAVPILKFVLCIPLT